MAERTVYFHGIPGSGGELALFGTEIAAKAAGFIVPDRTQAGPAEATARFRTLAAAIRTQAEGAPLRLVGFSLGAAAALRVAPHLGTQVVGIDLVSAAAPLSTGDYLGAMAGAPVFRAARTSPLLLAAMVGAQGLFARLAPGKLYAALFASALGADLALRDNLQFRAGMVRVLSRGLGRGAPGYRREILHYVGDWAAELAHVSQPVRLWHGRADNWSPVSMAEALATHLPRCEPPRMFDGLSHYSTLRRYLSER